MPHGRHIYAKVSVMSRAIICAYSQSYHVLPHWKCVMQCGAKCPGINLPEQKIDDQYSNSISSIHFHIYYIISCCSTHGRLPLNDKDIVASVNRILLQNNPQKYILEKN